MSITTQALRSRKIVVSIAAAISLMAVLTAAVSANSQKAVWDGIGQVMHAGPSNVPGFPTSTQSEFKLGSDSSVKSVEIKTTNELVIGVLGDGLGGGAITDCKDRKKGTACDELGPLLDGAFVTSLHTSTAKLQNVTQDVMLFPGIGEVPILIGRIRGEIEGVFAISRVADDGVTPTGSANGTASLRIGKGSTATYACFVDSPIGPIPATTLNPCSDNTGGMLFPISLDVKDKGKFEIGQGTGSLSDIISIEGKVEVSAVASPFTATGTIVISNAKTTLAGDEAAELHEADDDNDDEDDEEEDDD